MMLLLHGCAHRRRRDDGFGVGGRHLYTGPVSLPALKATPNHTTHQ